MTSNQPILVVDDQKNMCWILSKILAQAGFSVETANTAGEALSIVASKKISAAIIDYRLSDKNGLQLLKQIKEANSNFPAILITSYGSKELREEAEKAGFVKYFDKPFNNQALLEALRAALKL